jgi:hypothetical protein
MVGLMEKDLERLRDTIRRYQALTKVTTDEAALKALEGLLEEATARLSAWSADSHDIA